MTVRFMRASPFSCADGADTLDSAELLHQRQVVPGDPGIVDPLVHDAVDGREPSLPGSAGGRNSVEDAFVGAPSDEMACDEVAVREQDDSLDVEVRKGKDPGRGKEGTVRR